MIFLLHLRKLMGFTYIFLVSFNQWLLPGSKSADCEYQVGTGKGGSRKNAIGNGFETNVVHIRIFHTFRTAWNGFVKKRVS